MKASEISGDGEDAMYCFRHYHASVHSTSANVSHFDLRKHHILEDVLVGNFENSCSLCHLRKICFMHGFQSLQNLFVMGHPGC